MTPTEVETAARAKYNATGDTFYSSDEILGLMYEASLQMAVEALVIERTFTTTTVASQQEYDYPGNAITIKRVTYNGNKLAPISFREDDSLTLNNATTTSSGSPQFYAIWNETFILRPIPDAAQTLKVYAFVEPQAITTTSTLEIPSRYHRDLVNFIVAEMAAKDNNMSKAQYYMGLWAAAMNRAKREMRKRLRGDSPAHVMEEESQLTTILGST